MAKDKKYFGTREDGVILYRTYSTEGFKLRKVGTDDLYDDAVDVEDASYEYEETNIPIENDEITDSEALAIIRGETE